MARHTQMIANAYAPGSGAPRAAPALRREPASRSRRHGVNRFFDPAYRYFVALASTFLALGAPDLYLRPHSTPPNGLGAAIALRCVLAPPFQRPPACSSPHGTRSGGLPFLG